MADGYLIRVATLHKPFVFAKCWCEASNSRWLGCGIFLLPSVDVFFKVIRKIVFGG